MRRIGLGMGVLLFIFLSMPVLAKTVRYNLDIHYGYLEVDLKYQKMMAIAGEIPGPVIEATEGDMLEVTFNNKMDVESSIHWHGVLLPNDQDGVPYLTTAPIPPGKSHTYRFPVKHSGTYWYHSHSSLQEQRGLYGPIVFHPKKENLTYDRDYTLVLSDFSRESPEQIYENLKKDGDYYALKKGTVQSWDKVLAHGWPAVQRRLAQSWKRMSGMDVSDVGYDAFLANGNTVHYLGNANPGERVRVRIINSAASTYFNLEYSGGDMEVVAADGVRVQPFKTSRIKMGMAETYDVLVTIPSKNTYEFRASPVDGTGYTVALLGKGEVVTANTIPAPNPYVMQPMSQGMFLPADSGMNAGAAMTMKGTQHSTMEMGEMMSMDSEYKRLKSLKKTELSAGKPIRNISLNLTGSMSRYVWSFNNRTLSESDEILIKKGEIVRVELVNQTMMQHPVHLHGHFFRVLNGQGAYSPLKHTVSVPAMGSVTIEFDANEDKDWFFHCHNLYHMKAGMARVFRYEGSTIDPDLAAIQATDRREKDSAWFWNSNIGFFSNKTSGFGQFRNLHHSAELDFDTTHMATKYEAKTKFIRYWDKYTKIYIGINFKKEGEKKASQSQEVLGMKYMLPLFIESEWEYSIDTNELALELSSELQLTDRIYFEWEWEPNGDYEFELGYEYSKTLSFVATYDPDFSSGLGVNLQL